MDEDQKRYEQSLKDLTGNSANPIEQKVQAAGRGLKAVWVVIAFVALFLLVYFFDEKVFGFNIL
jgi:hypothetical protein